MSAHTSEVHVVKLGGSLLGWSETPHRLAELLSRASLTRPLLIVGGGRAADSVRDWQQIHRFDEATAHDLAVDAMTLNSQLLAAVVPQATLVGNRDEAATAWQQHRWPILDCAAFLPREEPLQPLELPHTWAATSDAIAAWVTLAWPASRLVLLKSTGLSDLSDLSDQIPASQLAAAGLIDHCLAGWLEELPTVDWVNLRAATLQPTRWHSRADQPVP